MTECGKMGGEGMSEQRCAGKNACNSEITLDESGIWDASK